MSCFEKRLQILFYWEARAMLPPGAAHVVAAEMHVEFLPADVNKGGLKLNCLQFGKGAIFIWFAGYLLVDSESEQLLASVSSNISL